MSSSSAMSRNTVPRWRRAGGRRLCAWRPEEVRRGCVPVLQEFVATSSGRDIRVWVTGDEVAGHVLRYNPSSFKSNFAAGGSFRQIPLPPAAASLAVAAARACGLFFAGVDLLFDDDAGLLCRLSF